MSKFDLIYDAAIEHVLEPGEPEEIKRRKARRDFMALAQPYVEDDEWLIIYPALSSLLGALLTSARPERRDELMALLVEKSLDECNHMLACFETAEKIARRAEH